MRADGFGPRRPPPPRPWSIQRGHPVCPGGRGTLAGHSPAESSNSPEQARTDKPLIDLLLSVLDCAGILDFSDCDSGCRGFESHQPPHSFVREIRPLHPPRSGRRVSGSLPDRFLHPVVWRGRCNLTPVVRSRLINGREPEPSSTVLRTGRRNRRKPPFKLRQRGASTFLDWMPTSEGASHPPAARRCGRPSMPSTNPPPIRYSSPARPSSSTSASPGSQNRRRSSRCDAGLARSCLRPPARPQPRWRRCPRASATTTARSSPLPPKRDARPTLPTPPRSRSRD